MVYGLRPIYILAATLAAVLADKYCEHREIALEAKDPPEYLPSSLEFFSHIPFTGGSAWSWHLLATFAPKEVGAGSNVAGGLRLSCTSEEKKDLRKRSNTCSVADSYGAPVAVVFGHSRPSALDERLMRPHHVTTFLRNQREKRLQHMRSAVENVLRVEASAMNGSAARAALAIFSPGVKPRHDLKQAASGCGLCFNPFSSVARYTWLSWLTEQPLSSKGVAEIDFCPSLAPAWGALMRMPWFGLLHRWSASVCLWHHVTRRPFPNQDVLACPPAAKSSERRQLVGHGTAPGKDNGNSVCPLHLAEVKDISNVLSLTAERCWH